MKILNTLVFILICSNLSYTQMPWGNMGGKTLKGKITGTLVDSITGESVPYATLVLKKAGKDKSKDGILSEDNGEFKFENVKTGKYDVYASFLGYKEKVIRDVELTLKDPDNDLKKVMLIPDEVMLDQVEIKGERALIENKVDRLVYNVEQDASIAGGDATDALRKVPLLSVDIEGNVSLRGSQNVRILINGKPSGMFSSNVADALKMFPADQIKKVEVITSPSAKYDGEGSAGIINIITKRENIEGMSGNVNASVGTRQNSLNLGLNAGKGRLGFSSNLGLFYSIPADAEVTFNRRSVETALESFYTTDGLQKTSRLGGSGSASMFYDFNAYNAINTSITYRGFGFDFDGTTSSVISDDNIGFYNEFTRKNNGDNLFGGYDWNTDYTKKWEDNDDRELVFAVQLSKGDNNQDSDVVEVHDLEILNRDAQIFNDGDNVETTLQVDYTQPLPKSFKLETGAKTVIRNITSDYTNRILDGGVYQDIPELSNVFDYDQDVVAGYGSLSFILAKKYSFITGVRYERTSIGGRFLEGDAMEFSNEYDNWLPNLTVSRTFKNFRTLKLSYSKRIQRPSLFYINPFNNNTDQFNRTIGNPQIDPELVHQVEMAYNITVKGVTVFASSYYKYTDAVIESILTLDENGVSVNSFDNVGVNKSVGLNLFATKSINKLTVRGGGNVYTYNATGMVNGVDLERKDLLYDIFFNGDYSISGTLKADFFGFFRSPQATLQGENPSFSIFGFGIRKDIGKLSLGIRVIEPFNDLKYFNSKLDGPDFVQEYSYGVPFRSIGVNIRYKFGKVDFKERKSKIKNTDQKQGEGQGGGQSGGGQLGG